MVGLGKKLRDHLEMMQSRSIPIVLKDHLEIIAILRMRGHQSIIIPLHVEPDPLALKVIIIEQAEHVVSGQLLLDQLKGQQAGIDE